MSFSKPRTMVNQIEVRDHENGPDDINTVEHKPADNAHVSVVTVFRVDNRVGHPNHPEHEQHPARGNHPTQRPRLSLHEAPRGSQAARPNHQHRADDQCLFAWAVDASEDSVTELSGIDPMEVAPVEHRSVDEHRGVSDDGPAGEYLARPTEKVSGSIADREAADQRHMPGNGRGRSLPLRGSSLQGAPYD